MIIVPVIYKYVFNLKVNDWCKTTLINNIFPHAGDIVIKSRAFDKFEEAVYSANMLIKEIITVINDNSEKEYIALSELNPKLVDGQAISKDWAIHEMAKIWIVDDSEHKKNASHLHAIGLLQILSTDGEPATLN